MQKKNVKVVSDEEIISALLMHGKAKDAAAAAGISERTLYDRMHDKDFQADYQTARNDVLRMAVKNLGDQIGSAVSVIVNVMNDKDAAASTRLQAATAILNYAGRFSPRLTRDEMRPESKEKGMFDFDFM